MKPNFSLSEIYGKLKRVTSSASYIPSLDGLRFFAITWVLLYHLHGSFIKKVTGVIIDQSWFYTVMNRGLQGVPLFFALSGFLACLPFAKHYLLNETSVSLTHYFKRRFIRISLPYYVVTIILFVLYLITGKYSLSDLLPHLAASLVYLHSILFEEANNMNVVFWALEVEMQFYLIAPLLLPLYFKVPRLVRRLLILIIIVALPFFQITFSGAYPLTLLNHIQYFLIGFVVCELYVLDEKNLFRSNNFVPVILVIPIIFLIYYGSLSERIVYPILVGTLFSFIVFNPFWKTLFGIRFFAAVGSMSYSVYLIHFPIIGFFGNYTMKIVWTSNYYVNFLLQCAILWPVVMVFSLFFYLLVEKPYMRRGIKTEPSLIPKTVDTDLSRLPK